MASANRVSFSALLRRWREALSRRRKGKEAESTLKPTAPPTAFPEAGQQLEAPSGAALIGKSVVIKGQIHSREDLYINGEMGGTLELPEHRLTIGVHGKVQADIKAHEAVIAGTVQGNIEAAEKIDIRREAKLIGDIRTARILIEDGAYFKGSLDIFKPEIGRSAAAV